MNEIMTNENGSLVAFDGVDVANVERKMKAIQDFQKLVRSQLVENKDYGVVPGSKKPSLLKPGAEKIVMLLGMTSDFVKEVARDYEGGFIRYDFCHHLYKNGMEVTQGFGTANSKEPKYASQNVYGVENTVMKMAKKRSLVDAALQVGSLSDIFTQDVDDMEDLQGNRAGDYKQQATDTSGCISTAQAKRLFAISKGNNDLVSQVLAKHGYEGKKSTDVQKIHYEKICEELEAAAQ